MSPLTLLLVACLLPAAGTPERRRPAPAPCEAAPEGMRCVPGGDFVRGWDKKHRCLQQTRPKWSKIEVDTAPVERVWLETFYMDETEVTYAAFMACVERGECEKAGPRYEDFDRPDQPIAGVSWFDADNYCRAQGKHLPTEAEWEKAARGPEGKPAPWGAGEATCEVAVIKDRAGKRSCGVDKAGRWPYKGRALAVKSRPAGVYGLYDMAGNVEEWVADWYSVSYGACGDACRGANPKGPCGGEAPCEGHEHRVVRGGSWYYNHTHANGYHRRPHVPHNRPYHHFGFRCAASVEEARALRR